MLYIPLQIAIVRDIIDKKTGSEEHMMEKEQRTLFVVYNSKDELYSNLLRKLVATNDDNTDTGEIVGTEDDSVNIVAWNEKQWLDNKGTIDTSQKVLFLGKTGEDLIPIIDEKYNKYGIVYGWAGDQAILYVDAKGLKKREVYNAFFKEVKEKIGEDSVKKEKKIGTNKRTIIKTIGLNLPYVWPLLAGSLIKDRFDDKKMVKDQQYFLGIYELYKNHLESFLNE